MNARTSITTDLDADTLALVERLALERGMTSPQFAAEAIRRIAESESDYRAFIQAGEADIAAGRVYTQDQVEAMFLGEGIRRDAA
ncbi:hypothetical protein ASE75_14140 [Sphingomonas sp. Leaf17]|uniref:CopG family ribbon-helix-helix protein n=1 Tax=Sphingomonas sp. Leaf17 TaxID=1735683 RepID=UPI000701EAF9|nr:hypothetical protein [Sphingomonas sp. Leaf17]KQM62753.1 hypothetical protein ASE75_14140 [Sphingomonas sp. Leaf17]